MKTCKSIVIISWFRVVALLVVDVGSYGELLCLLYVGQYGCWLERNDDIEVSVLVGFNSGFPYGLGIIKTSGIFIFQILFRLKFSLLIFFVQLLSGWVDVLSIFCNYLIYHLIEFSFCYMEPNWWYGITHHHLYLIN